MTDLCQFNRFGTAYDKEKGKFAVFSDLDVSSDWVFGFFDTKDEAKAYVKEIHQFLIAE